MKLKWAYVLFVGYSLIHVLFFFRNNGVLMDIIEIKADPLVFSLFNLMGLFPLSFLIYTWLYEDLTKKDYPYFIFSFMLGAFALTPYFLKVKEAPRLRKHRPKLFLLMMSVISMLVIIYGLSLGNFNDYISLFMSDSFVHIMTFDFLFMIGLSAYLMYPIKKRWYLGLIPVVGFYYLLSTEE
ncbi:MAG: hypothetical protein WCZ13_02785 [Acholeplasmataceae bacterium]